jgi:hypothetical protein
MSFDKFEWIRLMVGDRRLTVADRFVLTNAAIRYVRHGNDVLRVRQVTMADQFAVGARTVRQSISRARDLGYLVLAQPRQRGRSHHGADEYRLSIPADAASIPINTGTELPEYRHETTQIAARTNSLTSENYNPKGFLKGFVEGVERASAQPTPPKCSKHINIDKPPNCLTCKELREKWEAMKAAEAQAEKQARADALARRDACTFCDEFGFLLGPDGTSADIAIRCNRHSQEAS